MRAIKSVLPALLCLAVFVGNSLAPSLANAFEKGQEPENSMCLGCHGMAGFAMPDADGAMRQLHVSKDAFQKSVHAKRSCLECHQDIQQIPHQTNVDRRVGCVE